MPQDGQIQETLRLMSQQLGNLQGSVTALEAEVRRGNEQRDRIHDTLWAAINGTKDRVIELEGDRRALKATAGAIALAVSIAWKWFTGLWSG